MNDIKDNPNQYDPNLQGKLNGQDILELDKLKEICPKVEDQLKRQPTGYVREASIQIYSDLSGISGAIIALLLRDHYPTPKIAVAALFRSLIDCCISIFAFCKKPQQNAEIYHHFSLVLDWNFVCAHEKNLGCPLVPNSQKKRDSIQDRKNRITADLRKDIGLLYTKNSLSQEQLEKALAENRTNIFRDTWYSQKRREILKDEKIEWIYDVLYKRLSSATHSDPAGSFVLSIKNRSHAISLTRQFWGAGIYRLVEALNIRMNAEHKGIVRQDYKYLQGK